MSTSNHRIAAIDLGRGLSVVVMVLVHSLWMYGDTATQSAHWLGHTVHFLGKGTAAFLVAMGFSFMLARDQSLTGAMRRGLQILAAGYLLNSLKFLVPLAVGALPEAFIQAYGWQPPLGGEQWLYLLGTGDILQMAGLSFMLLGLVRHTLGHRYAVLILALLVAGVSRELSGLRLGIAGVDGLLDLLWGQEWNVYFPLFPWISCILIGMVCGMHFRDTGRDTHRTCRFSGQLGLVLTIAGGLLCLMDLDYHFGDFFHLGPGGALYLSGINLVALWMLNKLLQRFPLTQLQQALTYCSHHVTTLYIIQWTLVCWGMSVIGYQTLDAAGVLLVALLMLILSLLVNHAFLVSARSLQTKRGCAPSPPIGDTGAAIDAARD